MANKKLSEKSASLTLRPPSGHSTSQLASTLSGKTYVFPANDRHIEAASFEFKPDRTTLVIRTSNGENRIACGNGAWRKGRSSFVNGLDKRMVLPSVHAVAASGAWTADDIFNVKLCLYETPFYTTLVFRFKGEQLLLDSEYNVAFAPTTTTLPQLTGQAH